MEREVAWKKYNETDEEALEALAGDYKEFISRNKTERACAATAIEMAERRGYRSLEEVIREGRPLASGDKCGRSLMARRLFWCKWEASRFLLA